MAEHTATWTRDDTVDAWRHRRMYGLLDPLIEAYPGASWVTIGDGRYGNDAHYLLSRGVNVLATDISDTLLREAAAAGYIRKFRQENAEHLSFGDGAFEFVLCKESYHHFPRPALGLYEMLRVARTAVILLEPNDRFMSEGVLEAASLAAFRLRARLLRRPHSRNEFEVSGNYTYPVSRRELEKVALGLDLPQIAFRGFNDAYAHGVECSEAVGSSQVFRRVRRRIQALDLLTRLGLYKATNLAAALFRSEVSAAARAALHSAGFRVTDIPRNPHARGSSVQPTD
jgi:SAM-dependent methyltransferase